MPLTNKIMMIPATMPHGMVMAQFLALVMLIMICLHISSQLGDIPRLIKMNNFE